MSEAPIVEVLIVSFNTKRELTDTLNTLYTHAPPKASVDMCVSVFDNGSLDGSGEMVSEHFPAVRLVVSHENLGFGRATNRLAAESTADYVLLLNSDVLVTEDIISPLMGALARHPRALAAGPRLVHRDGRVQYSAQRIPILRYEFAAQLKGTRLGRAIRPIFDCDRLLAEMQELTETGIEREVDFLWATCWMVRRADVREYGLFADDFPMYDEDLDFCMRARKRARSVVYVPHVELIHLGGSSTASTQAKGERVMRARQHFYRRHRGLLIAAAYAVGIHVLDRLAAITASIPRHQRRLTS